jgi:vacuolar protein sorting-associated protein 54
LAKGGGANAYMETLAKETTTLNKVLSKYLQGPTLSLVMGQVFSSINSRLAEEFENVELKSDAAKERMLVDAKYLTNKLSDLKGTEQAAPGPVSFISFMPILARVCASPRLTHPHERS